MSSCGSRESDGRFSRVHHAFSLDNFDDGYIDSAGRFRVYCPGHERSYSEGYMLRSVVAYELYHGVKVPRNMDIHHVDGNRLNDSDENLVLLTHEAHTELINNPRKKDIPRTCIRCGNGFTIKPWRLNQDSYRGKYCSRFCYNNRWKP